MVELTTCTVPRPETMPPDRVIGWLGHESVETTQIYLDANLTIKEEALSRITPINTKTGRYRPDDDLLAFLKGL